MSKAVIELLEEQGQAFEEFKARQNEKISNLEKTVDEIFKKSNRPGMPAGTGNFSVKSEENKATADFIRSRGAIQTKGMLAGEDPSGGYTVYPTVADSIGQILRDRSPMRQLAQVITFEMGDSYEETFSVDAAAASWVGEQSARPETTVPDLKKLTVPAREIYAAPQATQRLIDDSSYDIVSWLTDQVSIGFAGMEGTAFLTGDGTLSPRGILSYPTAATADDSRSWATLQHTVTGNASGFASSNPGDALIDLIGALKTGYRANAAWLMNRSTAGTIRKFKDGQGNYLWQPGYQNGQPDQLLGFPVHMDENMPDVAANAFPVVFGDFMQGYRIVQKLPMRILVDPFTAKPHIIVYVYSRVGGDVRDFNALKLLKVST